VEVSTDGGRARQAAALNRFRLPWRWDGREAILESRRTDETGYRQRSRAEPPAVRGLQSHYYLNAVQSWRGADGRVSNPHA
jgi:sulfane dehydrogenase subunit SoxC